MSASRPRVAILGFSIECNRFAPVAMRAHFSYFTGPDLVAEARLPAPRMLGEIPGFVANMDATGPWDPVGIAFAAAEPNGPVDHVFFTELMTDIEQRLTEALPVAPSTGAELVHSPSCVQRSSRSKVRKVDVETRRAPA